MTSLLPDLQFALRMLWKHKAFTASAVATIGLAIAANTAIFTLVLSVLLRPLALPHPDRVVRVEERHRGRLSNVTGANFTDLKARARSFSSIAAYRLNSPGLSAGAAPEQVTAADVTADYFAVLGTPPALGRTFEPRDFSPASRRAVVLTHDVWQRHFGGEASAIGRVVLVNSVPAEVVGVMPPRSFAPGSPQLWLPHPMPSPILASRRSHLFTVIGRLDDDTSLASAKEEISAVSGQIVRDSAAVDADMTLNLTPIQERMVQSARPALLALWAAVALVLIIGAANVANLLLMQGSSRAREISIRIALGAPRARLVRQFATEALLLGLAGGTVGTLLGVWSIPALRHVLPATMPRTSDVAVTPQVVLFGLALSFLTSILFGAAPALKASGRAPAGALRDRQGESRSQSQVRALFVTAQVALTVTLLCAASLLARSFVSVTHVDLGFDPSGVVAFDLSLPPARYPGGSGQGEFLGRLVEALRTVPGVREVAVTGALPMSGVASTTMVPQGTTVPGAHSADIIPVSTGYIRALRIPLKRGRFFIDNDSRTAAPVVVLSEKAATELWPDGTDPIGRNVTMMEWGDPHTAQVIGIVGDIRQAGPEAEVRPTAYYPTSQFPESLLRHSIVIRAEGDPMTVVASAREQIWIMDRLQPIASIRTLDQVLAAALAQRRFNVTLLGAFSLTGLGLAGLGLYGIVAFAVGQRTREIGLRMALGAGRADVARLVCAHGAAPVAGGLVLGVLGALASARALESLLFGVRAADPGTFALVVGIVGATAAIACATPARRALKIDPAMTLRE